MEYCDGNEAVFEKIKTEVVFEETDIDMPDIIDIRKDLDVPVIKQEEVEKLKIDVKLEGPNIDMPDFIDVRKDLDIAVIKQEELFIKSESGDFFDDNR